MATALLALACATSPRPEPDAADPLGLDALTAGPVRVRASETRYTVRGSTVDEIRRHLEANGPELPGLEVYALARWSLRWSPRLERWGRGCSVRDPNVSVHANVILPRWEPPDGASAGLTRLWRVFLFRVRRHELGHLERVVESARSLHESLTGLRGVSCSLLRRMIDNEGRKHRQRAEAANRRYDRETVHGRNDGAVWPPSLYIDSPHQEIAADVAGPL